MGTPEVFDFVVIGAGPVGENFAQYATEGTDLTAVLIEQELVGGECSYWACMPSKALLRPIEVETTAQHLPGVRGAELDPEALLARRDDWVSHYDDTGQVDWAEGAGIRVIRGVGRLSGERQVTVETADRMVVLEARQAVVLATGSEAVVPEVYAASAPWGSRDATGVREVPARLAIVGGGVVACEAAVWMNALGSEVTMLVRGDRLLPRTEPFASDLVRDALVDSGIDVRLEADVSECRRDDARDAGVGRIHGGEVQLTVAGDEVVVDELLVATGRQPRLADVGLETVGLEPRGIADRPDWLVLVGDVSGEAPLTHWGKYRARVLGEQLAARAEGRPEPVAPDEVPVPQVVFTDPQVASVGLTEEAARKACANVVVAKVDWSSAGGAALLRDDATGAAQIVVDRASGCVVGATFVGSGAGELIHAATIAVAGRVPVHVLRHAVPSYPTASELWLRLLESLPQDLRRGTVGAQD
ncbi:NAD(P)/FAD-dependent oxidoreductase [Ammonicoccus fulvus]|uniref:NAD(P)/FAD-dependent oxidoreductase n=1 Tax=Ammonicoccus fulvus TaxID=3138240 RepID=A0ABZ3FM50_9ACTN